MATYKSIEKQNLIVQREELESRFDINADMLNDNTVLKYGVGVDDEGSQYLTTASIPDPASGGTIKVNAKNALLIGLEALAYKYNLEQESFIYNPDGRMRKLMAALMPECDDVNIESIFYKRLLTKTCRRDDIRNCRTGIPYKACFSYVKKNRYVTIDGKASRYTEEEISEIADALYEEVSEPYVRSKKMTPVIREVISETVDVRLQAEYGWKFSHQQYIDMQLNEVLIERIVKAFPENFKTLSKLDTVLHYDAGVPRPTGIKTLLQRPTTNPLVANPAWRKMMYRELRHPFTVIAEDFLENTLNLENIEERQSLIFDTVSDFVTKVNDERLQQTSFIRNRVDDRDRNISTKKDIDDVSDFLYLTLKRIENPEADMVQFDNEKMEALMLGDMSIDATDKEKELIDELLSKIGDQYYGDDQESSDTTNTKWYNKCVDYIINRMEQVRERYENLDDVAEWQNYLMPKPLDPYFGHNGLEDLARVAGISKWSVRKKELEAMGHVFAD